MSEREIVHAMLRQDFLPFLLWAFDVTHQDGQMVEAPYVDAICHWLVSNLSREAARLLIALPPRHLKSFIVSVAYPAWCLGRDPTLKMMIVSYGEDLAREHSVIFRRLLAHPRFGEIFPDFRIDRDTDLELRTRAGGYRRAVSRAGSITGHGADLIIADDLMKADEVHSPQVRETVRRQFSETISTRLNNPSAGAIIVVQQRLHVDDLAAHLLDVGYDSMILPAIAERDTEFELGGGRTWSRRQGDLLIPERFSQEELNRLRRQLSDAAFEAQYQQNPVPRGGARVDMSRVRRHEGSLDPDAYPLKFQSWDTASGLGPRNDYSVCTTWGWSDNSRYWVLIDLWRGQIDYVDLKEMVLHRQRSCDAMRVYVEAADVGRSVVNECLRAGHQWIWKTMPREPKEVRFETNIGRLYDGSAALPAEAPWLEELERELRAFPDGDHDDQVDSVVQALRMIGSNHGEIMRNTDPTTGRPRRSRRRR
ncbi:MAG: phage terminase large subunit [Minwuia sp.]|uniref:phage terminase large subunit n=1 Tax=Minwuia sp. TaxID=2493630 RepID=UPI003A8C6911